MAKVIARVTQDTDRPRGPDAGLSIRVPAEWLLYGATLEIELPRNLACAVCGGGGCDTCGRAGAVSLRGRKDPPEVVEVNLPGQLQCDDDSERARGLMLRIPDHGGLPLEDADLPRGNLLLSVVVGESPDAGVARIRRTLISAPPTPRLSLPVGKRHNGAVALMIVAWVVVGWVAWWALR